MNHHHLRVACVLLKLPGMHFASAKQLAYTDVSLCHIQHQDMRCYYDMDTIEKDFRPAMMIASS
jgi:hypothetical protein